MKSKKFLFVLLAALMVLSCVNVAFAADSTVSYEGGAEKFVFLDDDELFDNFKGVMPGDVLQQKITVKNGFIGADYVKVYLRAVPHDEVKNPLSEEVAEVETLATMTDFLAQLSLTVKQGETVIYQGSPDELDGLAENVLLGSFRRGESTELVAELSVPIELDNKYAYRMGEVDWVFSVEEFEDPTPPTGDDNHLAFWFGLMTAAALMALALLTRKKVEER